MNRLKQLRLENKMSQPALALRQYDSRIDVGMVSRFENDLCIPNEKVMTGIETVFGEPRELIFSDITIAAAEPGDAAIVLRIANLIPDGKENAISRERLCEAAGMSDRAIRRTIEHARQLGIVIINDQDGQGYYRSNEIEDLRRQYRSNQARAVAILRQQKHLKERIEALGVYEDECG